LSEPHSYTHKKNAIAHHIAIYAKNMQNYISYYAKHANMVPWPTPTRCNVLAPLQLSDAAGHLLPILLHLAELRLDAPRAAHAGGPRHKRNIGNR